MKLKNALLIRYQIQQYISQILLTQEQDNFWKGYLNPQFWTEDQVIKQNIRVALLKVADKFYDNLDLGIDYQDVALVVSLANYNWHDKSDFDVHIVIDFTKVSDDIKLVKRAMDAARHKWNLLYDLEIKGHPVQMYIQDIDQHNESKGRYSLLNNQWINKPSKDEPQIDKQFIISKASSIIQQIYYLQEQLKNEKNIAKVQQAANDLKWKLLQARRAAINQGGQYSQDNLIYKYLRKNGYIQKLYQISKQAYKKGWKHSISSQNKRRKYMKIRKSTLQEMVRQQAKKIVKQVSDELNPEFVFSQIHTKLLIQIAKGELDANILARQQLAKRGLDSRGKWVGIEKSKQAWDV